MAAPLNRRLLHESRAARTHLGAVVALGALETGLIIAQAALLATLIARAVTEGAGLSDLTGELEALAGVLAARALVRAAFELSGRLGAGRVMSELRHRLVRRLVLEAPGERRHEQRTGELAAGAVQGVDALEAYFAGYLPQLILASMAPMAVLCWAATVDPVTAVIMALSLPILIVLMVLVGKGTQAQTRKRTDALELLSAHFLDVVQGLATLRAYRREAAQERAIAEVGERYRRETMATLRIAFLSALVLELCAMIGTALVAATIGVQLVGGHLGLKAGLTVLLLVPELYNPLRAVGQQFHASANGIAASERIFKTLEQPGELPHPAQPRSMPDLRRAPIVFDGVAYEYPSRAGAALTGVDLVLPAGKITVLVGHSGAGKSTLARLLLRFAEPSQGSITCGGVDLREIHLDAWRSQVAWVPQRPTIFQGTVAENVRLGTQATDKQVEVALRAAGADQMVKHLPEGLATRIGEGGRRLSAGQCQRLALARAFLRDAPILVLDEPTAHLDTGNAAAVAQAIERLAQGRTTLLIVHRAEVASLTGRAVRLEAGRIIGTAWPAVELAA